MVSSHSEHVGPLEEGSFEAGFRSLASQLHDLVDTGEVALLGYSAERSDFVRFNRSAVRQATGVTQRYLHVELIEGERHAGQSVTLTGEPFIDAARLSHAVEGLRELLPHLPPDPHLLYSTEARSTARHTPNTLAPAEAVVEEILEQSRGLDLVGIYASGGMSEGFASSLGQVCWFETYSHNLDWSLYLEGDKAVKCGYAGHTWSSADFAARMQQAREQLERLKAPPRAIEPGRYRVVDVCVAWILVLRQQRSSTHQLTRLAIATLRHLMLDPRFLQRM